MQKRPLSMHCSMREATQERCSRTSTKKNATRKRHFLWQAVAALLLCSNPLLRSDGGQAHAFHSLQLLRHRQRIPKRALSGAVASKYPLSNSNDSFQHHNRTDNNSNAAAAAANSKNYKSRRHGRRRNKQQATPQRREWLLQTTQTLLAAPAGSLTVGKWHELTSILTAWGAFGKTDSQAPVRMEALLKRLWQEHAAGNEQAVPTIELYTALLDAWACAALFQTHGRSASQRAREILVLLQETYEDTGTLQPTQQSFDIVLHMVCRTEGALIARRLLAWMEYLDKSGKNVAARPGRHEYLLVLETYCASGDENAGLLAEGFLRHMQCTPHQPDTFCYNLAIRAWQRAKRGRAAAEHADRILEEMTVPKDLVTYASVISAWACSGMKAHAVSRAEALLREIEDDPNLEKPNTVVLNAIMSAWVKSRNPAAVDRTAEILSNMRTDTATAKADLISYNTHLHALSMHGKGQGLAQRAQALLLEMEQGHDQGRLLFAPNLFSYNLVIDAWVRSSEANAAMRAADMLRQLVKRDGVDPDTFSFNQVLGALSKSSVPGALRMAQELLVYMEDAYQSGVHPNAQPDIMSYTNVIVAHSRGGEKGAAEQAEQLLDRVKARYKLNAEKCLKPDRFCYNSLIDCWARSGEGTLGARKAEALLQEMQSMYEAGDEYMAPNIITYNALLNAWARSGTRCCGVKAEYYLDRMWQLYKGGDTKVKPNDLSYNTVINAISKSQNEGKAQKALRILRRMDKLYQAGNKEARPNEITYTAVLNSCAFPAVLDQRTRRKALDTAIFTLEELQSSRYGQPNQVTYGTFLKACANLVDDDATRRRVTKRTFDQCCKDGQVGEMVLAYLRKAAPADLYRELLADFIRSGASISVKDLPHEWRCNVRDKEGWKNRPFGQKSRAPRQRSRYQRNRRS